MVEIRPAELCDINLILPRQADIDEMWATNRFTPAEAMEFGINHGRAWFGFSGNTPLGIFGVVPMGHGKAVIWAIFTDAIERSPLSFCRACIAPLNALKSEYSWLGNFVDARNKKVIEWLKWLGFTVHAAEPHGPDGLPFHLFEYKHV